MSVSNTQFRRESRQKPGGGLAIEANGLSKSYGADRVLDAVGLTVKRGQLLALLGPNGAGKTTTVRILATLLEPDAGHARVAGHDVIRERAQVRRRISLTGQDAALDQLQSGRENLEMIGRLRQLPGREAQSVADQLLARLDLCDAADRRVASYSGGMRRRLDLAAGLIGNPEVMFLDEPTTGLDPRSRQTVWDIIRGLVGQGVTVLLTTQYLDEADALADRIAVLDAGRLVAEGSAAELKQRVAGERLNVELADAAGFAQAAAQLGDRNVCSDPSRLTIEIPVQGGAAEIRQLLDELDPQHDRIMRFTLHQTSLDDVFMALTGHPTGSPT
ncbi:MAG: ATP-binding cassette domain-containing protein [Solirubrobacteraceae bacterium]|jgi:ABC-2 type transport system ATP-binding protein